MIPTYSADAAEVREQQGNAERIREFKMGFESWRNVPKEKADGEVQN